MRRSALALAGLLVALGGCDRAPDPDADVAAIRELIGAAEARNNDGDVEGWVELFEDGAVYMPPNGRAVSGRDELREIARVGFSSWRSDIRIAPEEIVPSGAWAFARSRISGTATPAGGGEPIPIDLKELAVFHRQADGTWRIARLIGNSNLP